MPVTPYSRLDVAKYHKGKGKQGSSTTPPQDTPKVFTPNTYATGTNRVRLGPNTRNFSHDGTHTQTIIDENTFRALDVNPAHSS